MLKVYVTNRTSTMCLDYITLPCTVPIPFTIHPLYALFNLGQLMCGGISKLHTRTHIMTTQREVY